MNTDVIIVGAGAAGLMAARELGKAGKKVLILEARDRIGGRIYPLPESEWGYEAQGGAEFVHGAAPITRKLLKDIGLTSDTNERGEWWNVMSGEPQQLTGPVSYDPELKEKLNELTEDISVAKFFEKNFTEEKYDVMRKIAFGRMEGYMAGDLNRISVFALRDEVNELGGEGGGNSNIKEGYGALVRYLESECRKNSVEILLNKEVSKIEWPENIIVHCKDGSAYQGEKVIITVPIPVIETLEFNPALPQKIQAASDIGFGAAIKILLKFKTKWWLKALGQDFEKLMFMISAETVRAWWTQYPEPRMTFTGWMAGPPARELSAHSDSEILETALTSLSNIFKISVETIRSELEHSKIIKWANDPYTRGAYTYPTPESPAAIAELRKPVEDKIYFAGEAVAEGDIGGTVEAALSSGLEVAQAILYSSSSTNTA